MMFHFFAFSFLYLHLGFIPCSFSSQSVLPFVVPLLSKSFSQKKNIVEDAEGYKEVRDKYRKNKHSIFVFIDYE